MKRDLKKIISELTLEEKAGLCSGGDFWHTKAVERLGIPQAMFSDGPHGLRKQEGKGDHLGLGDSIPAVTFPAGCATASSFDTELMESIGETLGRSARLRMYQFCWDRRLISSVVPCAEGILNISQRIPI